MKRLLMILAAAGAVFAAAPASAMPIAPPAHTTASNSDVIQVRHGGWHGRGHHYGWHRGRGHHYGWYRGHHRHWGWRHRHHHWR